MCEARRRVNLAPEAIIPRLVNPTTRYLPATAYDRRPATHLQPKRETRFADEAAGGQGLKLLGAGSC